ncbi:MAG: aldo/keto reductase [Cyanobacteria bacterium J06592_8]
MKYNKFGNTELETSVIGLGAAPIGSRTGRAESLQTLHKALDLGVTFYDTAPSYGQGSSEEIIGEAFKKKRDQVVLTTKVGSSISSTLQLAAKFKPLIRSLLHEIPGVRQMAQRRIQSFVQSQTQTNNYQSSYIIESVEASLKRLRSEYIDLLLLHSPPDDVIERGEVFEVLKSLVQQGKIRYYGLSAGSIESALICLKQPECGISALQVTLNLYEQEIIDQLLPIAKDRGIAIVAREPFAHGKLIPSLGKSDGLTYLGPLESDDQFSFLTDGGKRTITQAALQFVLQTEGVSVALAGMSKSNHVMENVATLNVSPLSDQELEKVHSMPVKL